MSSSVDFSLPKLGPEMESGVLADWLVAEGDIVEAGQPLATIETDKVSTDLESPAAGRIGALVEAGAEYPVGTALATIGDAAGAPAAATLAASATATATAAPVPTGGSDSPGTPAGGDAELERTALTERRRGEPLASPVARRMAQAHGVALADIRLTVPQGTIRKRHVEAFVADRDARPPAAPASGIPAPAAPKLVPGTTPLTTMRKRIAERMQSSLLETAQITDFREHDVSDLIELRRAGVRWASALGFRPSFTDLLVRAAALALRAVPALNVSMTDDHRLTVHEHVNIGVAVAIPDGLVVPVVRRADELSLTQLHNQIVRLVDRARTDALDLEDLSGGTFTVTNIGSYGSEIATPILVPGQVGIVATGTFVKKPVVRNDQIVVGTTMSTSLTIDHRVVDGETAGRFQTEIGELLRNPDRLL